MSVDRSRIESSSPDASPKAKRPSGKFIPTPERKRELLAKLSGRDLVISILPRKLSKGSPKT